MNKDKIPAAMYIRMSTEHQKYSPENQAAAIREYAERNDYEIIKTYTDGGKSGLNIAGRAALQQMLKDVQSHQAEYKAILVLDVTRWGRFQDADESAYYEYICKRAGTPVKYCNEQFDNDGSPVATIVKGVKRTMAAEYSRELSCKVFAGKCRLINLGYRQGGFAGFGLRRMLVNEHGEHKGILVAGEHKSIATDRVILVPGPEEEQKIIRWMYKMFTEELKTEQEIADILNQQGVLTDLNRTWTKATVNQVLTNEKYIGNNVSNRISFKLKTKRVVNPESEWIRKEGAFEAIVDPSVFYIAKGIINARARRFSNDELLQKLKDLQAKKGYLSALIINESPDMPSSSIYSSRFGSLVRAYQLKGYSSAEIARKTGFTAEYINQISKLLFRGEERLINAVYTDRIPLNVAIDISDADDKDVQNVLREAYEAGQIRGNKLAFVKDLIERRIKKGKSIYKKKCSAKQLTAQDVQALYEQEIKRTKLIIAKNDRVENSLIFVTQSIKSLLGNENFYNLLKAEELEKLPKYLAERLQIHG